MKILTFFLGAVIILLASLTPVAAQDSTIDPAKRYAYSANAGWMDFRPSAENGTVVTDTCLSGFIYCANVGWISLGDGTPDNGFNYSNDSASDFGLNVDAIGRLTGYAYGANVGWIQFEQTYGKPQIDMLTGQFTGEAYSANLGWMVLDTTASTLATNSLHRPDSDLDGISDKWEFLHFKNLTTANAITDTDGDGKKDVDEYSGGTGPTDVSSRLRITDISFNQVLKGEGVTITGVEITFTVEPNRLYRIEYDDDLTAPWTDSGLGTFAPQSIPEDKKTIFGLPSAQTRFFRVLAISPL